MRLVALWRNQPLKRVLSSPFVRCVETVQPLADALGLPVEQMPDLGEGSADSALELVHTLVGDDAALCTHGDIIPAVLQALDRDGVVIQDGWKWSKAATWVLHGERGTFTRASYVPRPL